MAKRGAITDLRTYVSDYKVRHGCEHCGENHPAVLDLHHRDEDDKVMGVAQMVQRGLSMQLIEDEIRKCAVLCCNCHRRHHYENG